MSERMSVERSKVEQASVAYTIKPGEIEELLEYLDQCEICMPPFHSSKEGHAAIIIRALRADLAAASAAKAEADQLAIDHEKRGTLAQMDLNIALNKLSEAERRLEAARREADGAYAERNKLVAYLARQFPSGIARTAIEGWSPEWHGCVYIDTPAGQLSWHYHDREAHLFADLPSYQGEWDGHTTEQKYQRLASLGAQP